MTLRHFDRAMPQQRGDLLKRCSREQGFHRKGVPEAVRVPVLDSGHLEEFH